jgi:nicotinamidase-related amidase
MTLTHTALLLCDLQNDFLHEDGAYGRAGLYNAEIAALPARLLPLAEAFRAAGAPVIATHFTLVPDGLGEPLIAPHLKKLRPFLTTGDFAPGAWGQQTVAELQPVDFAVEKIAYSAFYMSRLEWLLRRLHITHLAVAGIVTNGGVASTIRDAAVRDFHVTVLADGCAAFDTAAHETALAALTSVAEVKNTETYLKEIPHASRRAV